jgi:DNA-binding CsgD family transcriptional regulator
VEHDTSPVRDAAEALAGRDVETAALDRVLAAARSGRPQLVVIEAEPGMGKTALLDAFLARHAELCIVRSVRCAEFERTLAFGVTGLLLADEAAPARSSVEVGRRLLALLGELQQGGPGCVVVAVDDEQWMDAASAQALRFALRRLRADRVLVLLARRPGPWRVVDGPLTTVLRPGPLDLEAVRELARRLRSWELPADAVQRLVARTGGMPLLVDAVLRGSGDPAQLEAGAGLPASAAAAAVRMLASVDEPARRLAEAVAVLAEPTDVVALGRTAEVADPSAAVTAAAAGGLVRVDGRGRVECAHALLREAVYDTLPLAGRRDLHARAAEWTSGDRRLAHRVAAADRPDPALVADLVDAATAARTALRFGLAASHRLRARAVCDDPGRRERLLLEALIERVEAQDLDGAEELASTATDAPAGALRSLALGLLARESGRIGPARTCLQEAFDLAVAAGDDMLAARAAVATAVLHVRLGEGVAATEVLARPSPVDDPELSVDARATAALGLWLSGDLGRALDLVRAVPISPEGTAWDAELVAVRGLLRMYAGHLHEALADMDQAIRFAHLWRPSTNRSRIYLMRSMTRFLLGDWDGASVDAAAGRALAQGGAEAWSAALALTTSVAVPAHRGQWDVAGRYLTRAKEASAGAAVFPVAEHLLENEAGVAATRDDHRAVLSVLAPGWSDERLHQLTLLRGSRQLMQARIAALAKVGRPAEAETYLARYEDMLHDFPEGPVPGRLGWLRGLVAEARAQPQRARENYAADLADDRMRQVPHLRAELLLASGRLERLLGNRRVAVVQLVEARDVLAELRAAPALQRCRAQLAACGVKSPGADPLALTQREEDVTALVRRGYTNKEVAAELFLTAKTVEYHLRNVYAKVGVTSRQQLRRRRGAAARVGDESAGMAGRPSAGG